MLSLNPWLALRIVIVSLLLRRIYQDGRDALRGEGPATRLIIPSIILIAAVIVANHLVSRPVAAVGLFSLDILFLILCIRIALGLRHRDGLLEQRLENALAAYFPLWFARLVGMEFTILRQAPVGVKHFFNPGPAAASTYVHGAKMMLAALIISVATVPDFIFTALIVPQKFWVLRVVLDALEIYACAWLFGIFGTMVARPHELSEDRVIVRNGIFQAAEIDRSDVLSARALGVVKKKQLPATATEAVVMCAAGVPVVEVVLREPTPVHSMFSLRPKLAQTLFFSSDKADEMCRFLSQGPSQAVFRDVSKQMS